MWQTLFVLYVCILSTCMYNQAFYSLLDIKMTRKKKFSKIKYLNRSDDSMNKIHGNICCK